MKKTFEAYDHNGNVVQLVDTGKCGGEGSIYIDKKRSDVCAKIYHKNNITEELHRKILAMVKNPPEDPTWSTMRHRSIAWPHTVLYDDMNRSNFIGYAMSFIDTDIYLESHKYYDTDDRLKEIGERFTWEYLFISSLNFTSTVLSIHNQGHCIGDLKETNILIAMNARVALIDCDSFQIVDKFSGDVFPTRVGSGEYSPPELMGANFRDNNYDRHFSDLFALGIMIFKFLMNGVHPYQAKGNAVSDAPTTYEKIIKGYFPYERRFPGVEPPDYAPPYDMIPQSIKDLFCRCFVDGHGDKTKRPTAQEWFNVLDNERKKLKKCNINDNHRYSDHLSYCPWCKIVNDTEKDIFPNHDSPIVTLKSIERPIKGYADYMAAKIGTDVEDDNVIHLSNMTHSVANHSSNGPRYVYPKISDQNDIVTNNSSNGSQSVGVYPKISEQHSQMQYINGAMSFEQDLKQLVGKIDTFADCMAAKIEQDLKPLVEKTDTFADCMAAKIAGYSSSAGSRNMSVYPKISAQYKIPGYQLNDNRQTTHEVASSLSKEETSANGLLIIIGLLLSATGIGAIIGIPLIILGLISWISHR